MDLGGLLVLVGTGLLLGGPLYAFVVRRQAPVPRDWSGRPRGGATPGHDALGE